jgi:hypothetical protein
MFRLELKPKTWMIDGVSLYNGPTFKYDVLGTPEPEMYYIINAHGQHRQPLWKIENPVISTLQGQYQTPQLAAAALEDWMNKTYGFISPTANQTTQ